MFFKLNYAIDKYELAQFHTAYDFLPPRYLFIFNWKKTALQCCTVFSCTTMQISLITSFLTLLPLPTLFHPSRPSQSAKLGSLC